jgi:hypothetical protein
MGNQESMDEHPKVDACAGIVHSRQGTGRLAYLLGGSIKERNGLVGVGRTPDPLLCGSIRRIFARGSQSGKFWTFENARSSAAFAYNFILSCGDRLFMPFSPTPHVLVRTL